MAVAVSMAVVYVGTTRELYTWSLLSCVVLFLSGSCFS
eukprot:COSAG02_NODE_64855_length_259_cov_0.950000_1_plen_37_part_10